MLAPAAYESRLRHCGAAYLFSLLFRSSRWKRRASEPLTRERAAGAHGGRDYVVGARARSREAMREPPWAQDVGGDVTRALVIVFV
jgi:hypothetical protein